jgi:glycosyltransferase involved in cell wall biosynthesis
LRFDTNLVVINPEQSALFDADYGAVARPGRRTIGFWHWDVEYVPPHVIDATRYVDEIWVVSPFTGDALGAVVGVPVRVVDVGVPEPSPALVAPDGFELGAGRYTFLVTFDHLSLTERKNPIGAIEAYRRAFPEPRPDGPQLIVKSVNASHRWSEHERVRLAAGFRPDIRVVDRRIDRPSQLALIRDVDCLVSLHRSEGLGLHLMEAMWLGTPTIATRYSGNLHFQDDTNAALVDAALVPVTRVEGFFPAAARWADPDLDQAARWMRALASDAGIGAALADAARAKMRTQPTQADAGANIARVAGLEMTMTSVEER